MLESYYEYYIEELELLQSGISEHTWQTAHLATRTYEEIFHVVDVLRSNGDSKRPDIRSLLRDRFPLKC